MARYIDADKLIEALKVDFDREGAKATEYAMQKGMEDISIKYSHGQFCFLNAMERVKDIPTADVVPKSEVKELKADLEVWKQNRFNIFQRLELYKMTRQEVAREIFAEIDRAVENAELEWGTICGVKLCIAELKKKYTEGETR